MAAFGIASTAITALAVDKLVLSGGLTGPSEASAGLTNAVAAIGALDDLQAVLAEASRPREATVAELLERAAGGTGGGAALFQLPSAWTEQPAPAPGSSEGRPTGFAARHSLSTVVLSGGQPTAAIIDGRPIRVGDTLDGARLVRLEPDAAYFDTGSREEALRLTRFSDGARQR